MCNKQEEEDDAPVFTMAQRRKVGAKLLLKTIDALGDKLPKKLRNSPDGVTIMLDVSINLLLQMLESLGYPTLEVTAAITRTIQGK